MKTTLTILLLSALLSGCGLYTGGSFIYQPTSITSFTDPTFSGRRFAHIAVLADTADLGWRHGVETGLVAFPQSRRHDELRGYPANARLEPRATA